jgi:16S rRNA (adenine1518-N6/adenine1519-N6)-dimethyltransferase
LTRALLAAGARDVVAIERDGRCLPALADIASVYPGRLTVVDGDALRLDIHRLGREPRRIVANLPYNIGTALLLRWLAHSGDFESLTLMLQREVVDRLTAKPRSKEYGRLSVITQWLTVATRLFDVPPRAFVPPPKVISSVVRLVPRPQPLFPARMEVLERVTQAAFGQRRKMLRQSLRSIAPNPEALLGAIGVSPTARAEELSIQQFCEIATALTSAN